MFAYIDYRNRKLAEGGIVCSALGIFFFNRVDILS